jgi:sugar lactone lactonase YvrE
MTGTMNHRAVTAADGSLCRLDPNIEISRLDTGLAAAGGISFSPDGGAMHVSEQLRGAYYAMTTTR